MMSGKVRSFRVQALGCKVNQYDARQIARLLENFGLHEAYGGEPAGLVVLHSCAVTAEAARKSRQMIRRLRRDNPGAYVFLTGCAAADGLAAETDGLSARVAAGPGWLERLADAVLELPLPKHDFTFSSESDELLFPSFAEQTRAFLKVQDGCDKACAYCIIWKLRKMPRDKAPADVIAEARMLAAAGYREVVVTGINLGLYGRKKEYSLASLLQGLSEIDGLERIRLGSLHPDDLSGDLLRVWASSPKIMPHIHLSLQSGCTETLRAMNRGYTAADVLRVAARARELLGNPAFTADVIVGFPGETDVQFEASLALCRQTGFAKLHVFPFSARPGTAAAEMKEQVPGPVAQQRSERMQKLSDDAGAAFFSQFAGQRVSVLAEQQGADGFWTGFSEHYVPVRFRAEGDWKGKIVSLIAESADADGLTARFCGMGQ